MTDAKLVILVVEDQTVFSRDVVYSLSGQQVIVANSVEESKQIFDAFPPHITFLDIGLPDGTGFEVLDHILDKSPQAYVVMLTGSKMEQDVKIALRKGARGYIAKPITKARIDAEISRFLSHQKTMPCRTSRSSGGEH